MDWRKRQLTLSHCECDALGSRKCSLPHYPSLKGKSAYVTGGAGGIGEAVSYAFARNGAHVGILDIDAEAAKSTCRNGCTRIGVKAQP